MFMLKVIFHAYNPLPPNFFSKGKEILTLNILLLIIVIILDVTVDGIRVTFHVRPITYIEKKYRLVKISDGKFKES